MVFSRELSLALGAVFSILHEHVGSCLCTKNETPSTPPGSGWDLAAGRWRAGSAPASCAVSTPSHATPHCVPGEPSANQLSPSHALQPPPPCPLRVPGGSPQQILQGTDASELCAYLRLRVRYQLPHKYRMHIP